MNIGSKDLPPHNKISLSVWFDRISRRFGPDKLMQAANAVLARHSSRGQIDWPLKREAY